MPGSAPTEKNSQHHPLSGGKKGSFSSLEIGGVKMLLLSGEGSFHHLGGKKARRRYEQGERGTIRDKEKKGLKSTRALEGGLYPRSWPLNIQS